MSMTSLLQITPWPGVSAGILLTLLIVALYMARFIVHHAIYAFTDTFAYGLRLASKGVMQAERRLSERNRQVLLATGKESKERLIEREYVRISDTVRKDLGGYADIHRRLSEAVLRIEEDQEKSVQVPPDLPGWKPALEFAATLDSRGNYGSTLTEINKSMVKSHDEAIEEYRRANKGRTEVLAGMRQHWRMVKDLLPKVNKNVETVLARGLAIDRHMEEYDAMLRGEERAISVLASSSIVYFFISLLVLGVATAGAAVNFTLIARPMSEMVGGANFIGPYRTADIAALVIIMVEISMGLFLMESLRITRLFPVVGALSDRLRHPMIAVTFIILLLMASIEAGLAYMRDLLMQDELATAAALRGEVLGGADSLLGGHAWITTAAQMGMGFILPFALIFVAIPLETFVHSLRTVLGAIGIGILRSIALLLRMLSTGFRQLGTLATSLYDLPLFIPLFIHTYIGNRALEEESFGAPETLERAPSPERTPLPRKTALRQEA
jgi:hypothetical protein